LIVHVYLTDIGRGEYYIWFR